MSGLLILATAIARVARRYATLLLIGALLLGSAVMSLRQASIESAATKQYFGKSAFLQMQVVTDPTATRAKVFGSTLAPQSYSFLATALSIGNDSAEFRMRVPIRVITENKLVISLLPGQRFSGSGKLITSNEARVAGIFLLRSNFIIESRASPWARTLNSIRYHLRELSKGGDAGALVPGMVLGDTSLQSAQFREAMRRCGLTHLTAVSGANFAIISIFVLWCMQWFVRSMRWRIIFTAIALAGFIGLVRPSPSVLRAAAMASVVLFAKAFGKRSDSLPALGFAIAAVVIADPWQGRDPGFALSVLATAGLLLLAPKIAIKLSRFLPRALAQALAPPTAAVVMCAPILVALSGYIGPMTILANLLVAPVVAIVTVLGFIAALLSPISPMLAGFILYFAKIPAGWISLVAHWAARFPVLELTTGAFGFVIALSVSIALYIFYKFQKRVLICAIIVIAILTWFMRWPGGDWQIANCDVGQGDSLVINLGDHRAIVIDAGPDASLEDRCLNQLGIREISLLVLTHFHADHVEGVAGLTNHRLVRQVWVSSNNDPLFESQRIIAMLHGIPLMVANTGMTSAIDGKWGKIYLQVLWPDLGTHDFGVLPGDGSAINNSSIALLVRAPDFSLFAAGDLEPPAQAQIVAKLSAVDIYKVSHHGSSYQDQELMARLSPKLAVISVGEGNSYGHPAAQTLAALTRLGSRIYRTDKSGGIAISAKSHHFKVRTGIGNAWWQKVRLG
ncbi:MAG: ComEC/Rec2 family competence protein [Actinobacteria bacterium]|nr:ComEC/Rec2 family competence protein [Actinomycetota bacterium]